MRKTKIGLLSFDLKHKDKDVRQIIDDEGKDSAKVITEIRDAGRREDNRLKAAMYILNKVLPDKHELEVTSYEQRIKNIRDKLKSRGESK